MLGEKGIQGVAGAVPGYGFARRIAGECLNCRFGRLWQFQGEGEQAQKRAGTCPRPFGSLELVLAKVNDFGPGFRPDHAILVQAVGLLELQNSVLGGLVKLSGNGQLDSQNLVEIPLQG